tara:strand:- start:575 stop:1723 length:1149 start_codon:yes stop_codon:yes gene_type:complete
MAWTAPRTWVAGELVTAALLNTHIRDNQTILKTAINDSGQSEFTDATELTIASGVITVTQNFHKVDTQSDGGTDDLDTITAGTNVAAGFILTLRVESAARTVVLKAGTTPADNLDIGADVTLDESYKTYSLVYDGTNWRPFIYASTPTFASLSPLTTRGDILYSSSGTVTGTRLAKGAANTVLGSDGTDTAWQLKPLTTRGDILYGSSGVPTGTRLAVGGANEVLTSDGTDVAWAAASAGAVSFIGSANGSTTTTADTMYGSTSISGLAVTDTLMATWSFTNSGGNILDPRLVQGSVSTQFGTISENHIAGDNAGSSWIRVDGATVTEVSGYSGYAHPTGSSFVGAGFTAADFTGSYNVGLAFGLAGGTTVWQIQFFKIKGS